MIFVFFFLPVFASFFDLPEKELYQHKSKISSVKEKKERQAAKAVLTKIWQGKKTENCRIKTSAKGGLIAIVLFFMRKKLKGNLFFIHKVF